MHICLVDAENRFQSKISSSMMLALAVTSAVYGQAGLAQTEQVQRYQTNNDIPPRLQWEANFGYCGEVSFISAGLYYGQYVSQYEARAIASPGIGQAAENSQLLLGVNDAYTAREMHLAADVWPIDPTLNADDFLVWVKQNVSAGYPVIIGVFMNYNVFYGSDDPLAGDSEYDHIVPVTGVSSKNPFTGIAKYDASDTLSFSDNGLNADTAHPDFTYTYSFGSFPTLRADANGADRAVYSLPRKTQNYGIAITGIIDDDGQTLPIRLVTDVNFENPAIAEGATNRPALQDVTLTVTVSGLKAGVAYTLYRYDDFASVPNAGFNRNAAKAAKVWSVQISSGSVFSVKETIQSDEVAIYRAVPNTAP